MAKLPTPITRFLELNHDRWALWTPVALGIGIAIYFSLSWEPEPLAGGLALGLCSLGALWRWNKWGHKASIALFLTLLGFNVSLWRTWSVNPRPLWASVEPVTLDATIRALEHLEAAPNLSYRLTLEKLEPVLDKKTRPNIATLLPHAVRITARQQPQSLRVGQRIRVLVKLLPFQDPLSPRGYDFGRQAFFQGIGASGYALSPPQILTTPPQGWSRLFLSHLRQDITQTFLTKMPAPAGALATALVTGDTRGVPSEVRQNFANAGLAHLLAISGLHLSIVAGFFFISIRSFLALIPPIALRVPLHKLSAVLAIFGMVLYGSLAGGAVPIRRAFVMTSLVMLAILMDRKALTLRLWAVAAMLLLLSTPEVLLGPSFQLSFAAVLALISSYEMWSKTYREHLNRSLENRNRWVKKIAFYLAGSTLSSIAATLATTPYEVFTFHQMTLQGIAANLVAIPLTAFVILPCAVITCFLISIDMEWITLPLLGTSLQALSSLAAEISTWPGAVIKIGGFHPAAVPLITLGGLWFFLWKGSWRWAGFAPIAMGIAGFWWAPVPNILVDGSGRMMGYYDQEQKILFVSGKQKFTTSVWLQMNGITQHKRLPYRQQTPEWLCDHQSCFRPSKKVLLARNARASPWCTQADIVVSTRSVGRACAQARLVIDASQVKRNGSHEVSFLPSGHLKISTSRQTQGKRPWTRF